MPLYWFRESIRVVSSITLLLWNYLTYYPPKKQMMWIKKLLFVGGKLANFNNSDLVTQSLKLLLQTWLVNHTNLQVFISSRVEFSWMIHVHANHDMSATLSASKHLTIQNIICCSIFFYFLKRLHLYSPFCVFLKITTYREKALLTGN